MATAIFRARKKSQSTLSRKRSNSATSTPSNQKPRDKKSAPYRDPRYKILLMTKGSFIDEPEDSITEQSKEKYLDLLASTQTIPKDSLFRDDLFKHTCRRVEDKNETRVIRDLTPLMCLPQKTYTYGAEHLQHLRESINEGWNFNLFDRDSTPARLLCWFAREAFSNKQLAKLSQHDSCSTRYRRAVSRCKPRRRGLPADYSLLYLAQSSVYANLRLLSSDRREGY